MWGASWFGWRDYGREEAWISFGVTLAIVPLLTRRVRLGDVIAVLGLTVLSLFMHRFVLMWAVAVIPLWADALAFSCRPAPPSLLRKVFIAVVLAISLVIAIVSPCYFAEKTYPFEAVDSLRSHGVRGPVYCNFLFGGVLSEAGHKVSHDGRYYLFTREQWAMYNRTARGEVDLDAILARHDPAAFVLRKDYDAGLIALLQPRWHMLHDDELAIVFA